MKVYLADVRPLSADGVFEEKMQLLPKDRREKILRCQRQADRLRGLGAGLLLEYGLGTFGYSLLKDADGKKKVETAYGVYGKPYAVGADAVHFNLSHSGDYVAAVFSSAEAGIDIEQLQDAKMAVAHRFFKTEEYRCLKECPQEEQNRLFTKLWTRKEAYIKAVGEGMRLPLTSFSVLEESVSGEEEYRLQTWEMPEGYSLSVCVQQCFPEETTPVFVGLCKNI